VNTVLTDLESNKYYSTTIELNGESNGDTNFDNLMSIVNGFGTGSFDVDDMSVTVGKLTYEGLSQISDAGIDYTLADGAMRLPSFYDFAMDMMEIDSVAYTADQLKSAIQSIRAQAGSEYYIDLPCANNYTVNQIVYNEIAQSINYGDLTTTIPVVAGVYGDVTVSGTLPNYTASFTDAKFAAVVNLARNSESDNLGEFVQLAGIPSGTEKGNASVIYEWLKDFGNLSDDKEYVALTFETNTSDVLDMAGSSVNLGGLVPDKLYMTLVLEYNSSTKQMTYSCFRLNAFGADEQTLLVEEVLGMDSTEFDAIVSEHVSDATALISGYEFSIKKYDGEDGCATISLPLTKLITT
ncbi:MAG: hypothetical protein IJX05_02620, partial [Clostridia bacterium]|nr:hypothetical protein [Clostridia bacterium]